MDETPDARTRRVLREHGLPEGLLPGGITKADIAVSGAFTVVLPRRVERSHGGYRVRFGPVIRGTLQPGRVVGLRGVEAKQLLWFPVGAIDADGATLLFAVGPTRHRLGVADFPWP